MATLDGEIVTETLDYDGGRPVTVYIPSHGPEAVVFAADGAWHISQLAERLEGADVPATMIVGVHGLDDDARLNEYSPDFDEERFASHEKFFVGDVHRWVKSRFELDLPTERTAVWGASAGGEFAIAMGLRHPDVYGVVFCASPGGYEPPEVLPSPLPRFYFVGGKQEQWFLDNATAWAEALRRVDADVVIMEREGEHGGAFWGEEFPLMVDWAFARR